MDSLFGKERCDDLRATIKGLKNVDEREEKILCGLEQALKEVGGEYMLTFRFKNDTGTRTTHHLVFVCKDFKGYEIMKQIMASESSSHIDGVPSYELNPSSQIQSWLFPLSNPLRELQNQLLAKFKGRRLSMIQIYQEHNVGTPYIKKNYKDALLRLEVENKIITDPTCRPIRLGEKTFGDKVFVTFL